MRGERELYRDKIEVSLDGKQVFTLFFGGAVIACLVFVLGITVGRRLESRAHADTIDAQAAAGTDPLAALDLLAASDDLDTPAADELSFPRTLGAPAASPEPSPEPDDAGAEAEADSQARAAKAEAEKAKAEAEAKAAAEKAKAAAERAKAEAEAKAAAEKAAKAAAEKAKAEEKKAARFTLQLSSFQAEAEATTFYDKLRSAGYEPYVIRAEVPDKGTWFRVRLGKYASYEDAIAAKQRFEDSQKIIAYVTPL